MAKYGPVGSISSFPEAPDIVVSSQERINELEKHLAELEKEVEKLKQFRIELERLAHG